MSGQAVQKALIFTLSVHAVALLTLTQFTVREKVPAANIYAELEFFVPIPTVEEGPPTLSERLDEKIANLRADASSESSSEARSTGLTAAERAAMEADIASELANLESSELARLAADEKEFDTVGLPSESDDEHVDTMDDWDKQYDGRVTVRFALTDRSPSHLDVPGYQCRGRADIEVSIVVAPSGKVLSAEVLSGATPGSCFALAAIRSAEASRFLPSTTAPRRQEGTLSYAFVAQ
jgi:hypothetical protein